MPSSHNPADTDVHRDLLEALDVAIKVKEYVKYHKITVHLSVMKSWLPMGKLNAMEALRIERMNLALEVLGYYYLRTRVVDLSKLKVRKTSSPTNRVNIRGHDGYSFVESEYRSANKGGHLINFHTARRAHDIIRQVFSINLLKPDWETAINSCDTFKRINIPSINKRPIMEPEPNQALYNIIPKRAKIRVKYTTGVSNISSLPKVTHFPLDEVNISAMSGEDERQRSSVRGHLRPENQIKDLSCRHMEISTQEFWQISKNHVTRLMNLGRRPQELAETSARLIIRVG